MKRTLAFLCALALMLSLVPGAAFAATQDLQAEIDAGAETIVLEADASDITVTRDTTIDLNGHDLSGVTVLSGTLYLQDSQTADYTVADGVYGHVTGVTGNVKAADGYLQVGDSFHAVNLDIYAMTLRATDVGVYYKSHFAADEIVAAQVESFGVALSVVTAPNASNLETYCGYSDFTGFEAGEGANSVGTSTLLKGIMKAANGDSKNAKNAAMPVYGRAYIKTSDGYFFGETVKRSLQEQVEAIDKVWNKLTDAQKTPVLAMLEGYTSVMENWNIPNIRGIQVPGADADIEIPIEVTAENGIVTETVTVEANGVCVTVPAGTKLAANATGLTVLVTEKETSEAGLTLEESEVLMPMDVHVEGLAADNTAPLTIYLGKVMAENLNMGNYAVYHVENGKANEMVLIPVDAEFTAHNQYKYSLDGELTLYMATFSEVAVVSEEPKWEGEFDYSWYDEVIKNNQDATYFEIRNADQLAAFGAIVGGMVGREQDSFSGKTIKLLADIDLNDAEENNKSWIFHPIGYWNNEGTYERLPADERVTPVSSGFYAFEGTFDGNGNTISNFYHNTWEIKGDHNWYDTTKEQYFRDGMGLFGKVYGGTVKNLTVKNFSSDGEIATTGVIAAYADGATFENIAIFNCNPRVYNIGNGGIVGCVGWYAKEADLKTTFKNITVDQSNKISALWGTYDVSCGGIVGQYYAVSGQTDSPKNAGMTFTNCHVAAVMDVHNDVCANYQYYWYRYSGMMIGTIRANIKDKNGYTVADTRGIEFIDCTYTLGDWNQYWYCELVKNSLASYTHDHQFSRLTTIKSLSEIQDENGNWDTEGNFVIPNADNTAATCYHIFKNSEGNLYQHFHDKGDETNGNQPYETVNGVEMLKEDRTCYFIPFNQIYNGLGYGVKPTYKYADDPIYTDGDSNDLKEVAGGTVKADKKFESLGTVTTYRPGQTITLGQLVESIVDDSVLSKTSIYAAVSPATENDKVSATYSLDLSNWENSTITFAEDSIGSAKIVITDYFYCTATVIYLDLEQAAEKFTANTVSAQNAYTQITLGTLFGVKDGATIGNVTATVTDPNGKVTTVTGNSSDWTTKTIDLIKDGQWTVDIKDDDAFCTVTTASFTVNPVDKFDKKFDKNFLYRVGNENSVGIGYIFEEINKTDIALSNVSVAITKVKGDAAGTYTANETWTSSSVKFTGTGVVKVTITADGANAVEQYFEVVQGKNVLTYSELTNANCVLLSDLTMDNNTRALSNATWYGNDFTIDAKNGPTNGTGQISSNYLFLLNGNATLNNVRIVGKVYTSYGLQASDAYNRALVLSAGVNNKVLNCYLSNTASPLRVRDGKVEIINSTLKGGNFANLDIRGGNIILDNATTINQVNSNDQSDNGKAVFGFGVVVYYENVTENTTITIRNGIKQYNHISKNQTKQLTTQAQTLTNEMFVSGTTHLQYTDSSGDVWVNAAIVSMHGNVGDANITDVDGYLDGSTIVKQQNGYVHTYKPTAASINEVAPQYIANQFATNPSVPEIDNTRNDIEKTENPKYCYKDGSDIIQVGFKKGDSLEWATDVLKIKKDGKTLSAQLKSVNGNSCSDAVLTLTEAGEYILVYTYEDPYNYRLSQSGSVEEYTAAYEMIVYMNVAVEEDLAKHAEFTFGSNKQKTEKIIIGSDTYVSAVDVSDNNTTWAYITVSGVKVYYPIVEATIVSKKTAYFNVFKDVVEITDYADKGLGSEIVYGASTKTAVNNLKVTKGKYDDFADISNDWSTLNDSNLTNNGKDNAAQYVFKYAASADADGMQIVYSNALCYKSPDVTKARNEYYTIAKYCYTDEIGTPHYYYVGYHMAAKGKGSDICVTPNTLVTMSDGTQKEIQYVTYEDEVLVWNFYTGKYEFAPVSLLIDHGDSEYEIVDLQFSDGTNLEIVGCHGVFNKTKGEFVDISAENVEGFVGDTFLKQSNDGFEEVVLAGYEVRIERNGSYTILSAGNHNAILNGMLTLSPSLLAENLYEPFVIGEDMKYDEAQMQADIEAYGLYTYEDFAEYITYEQFEAWGLAAMKVTVGKGYTTYENIVILLQTIALPNA